MENNINRVLFSTQLCQSWDTDRNLSCHGLKFTRKMNDTPNYLSPVQVSITGGNRSLNSSKAAYRLSASCCIVMAIMPQG